MLLLKSKMWHRQVVWVIMSQAKSLIFNFQVWDESKVGLGIALILLPWHPYGFLNKTFSMPSIQSIHYPGGLELILADIGQGQDTPWTSRQFITGPTYKNKQPFTLTCNPVGNIEWPINLTCMSLNCGWKLERTQAGTGSTCKLSSMKSVVTKDDITRTHGEPCFGCNQVFFPHTLRQPLISTDLGTPSMLYAYQLTRMRLTEVLNEVLKFSKEWWDFFDTQ